MANGNQKKDSIQESSIPLGMCELKMLIIILSIRIGIFILRGITDSIEMYKFDSSLSYVS